MTHYKVLEKEGEDGETEVTIPSHKAPRVLQRVECLKCHKPAVRYQGARDADGRSSITYEHRDEPPVRYYMYRGKYVPRYRRCSAGYSIDGMKVMREIESGQEEEQQQQQDEEEIEEEPEASNTIVDVPKVHPSIEEQEEELLKLVPESEKKPIVVNPQSPYARKLGRFTYRDRNPPDKLNYKRPLPKGHRPTGAELYKMMRVVRVQQEGIQEDQQKIFKELNAIRSIMEMMIKGDVTLTAKSPGDSSGIG